jgi:LysM repeat protein
MANKKSIGLPGGPNEYITHVSEMFSTEGYKRNSPDVNNPVNIIESSNITMNGVDFPVRGYGNNGKVQDMMPGVEHYDYGNADYVVEVPMAQTGVEVEKSFEITPELLLKQAFVESLLNPKAKNDLGYKGIAQIGDDLISDYKKANKVESVDPFNAQQNHDVQEWSMNELYNSSFVDKPTSTAENRLLKSLASYNWGRGKVLKLLTEEKANGTDIYTGTDWTEKLPQQTKDYINMIVYDGSTEKRPLVQENFIKATKDDKYKEIRDIYKYQYGGDLFDERANNTVVQDNTYTNWFMPKDPFFSSLKNINKNIEDYKFDPSDYEVKDNPRSSDNNLENNHVVAKGESLGLIAKKYNTSVSEIASLNNIQDPNLININQKLKLPNIEVSDKKEYVIKAGDTLNEIAKKHGTTSNKLAEINGIEDINIISINQRLQLPDNYIDEVSLAEESWISTDKLKQNRKDINGGNDESIVVKSQMLNDPNQRYVVIDKKSQRLKLYQGDNVLMDFEVGTGKNVGDAQTVTKNKYIDPYGNTVTPKEAFIEEEKDGRIVYEKLKPGYKSKVDWSAGNKQTGAGKFTMGNVGEYKDTPSFTLVNENGIEIPAVIHATLNSRKQYFDNDNIEDNRMSNGCINGKCTDLEALYNTGLPPGSPVFILPEEEGNYFEFADGQAVLRTGRQNRIDAENYTDSQGREQKGQGINRSTNTLNYKEIRPVFDEEKFKEDKFTYFDFDDTEEYEGSVKPFVNSLVNNKQKIMKVAGISSDQYNEIAQIAFGILGNETNFGDTHTELGNAYRGARKKFIDPKSSSPDYQRKFDGYSFAEGADNDYNSVGLTQLRYQEVKNEGKKRDSNGNILASERDKVMPAEKMFNDLGITSNADLMDPEKAAIATIARLAFLANNRKGVDKNDLMNTLPGFWGGSSKDGKATYIDNVKKNSKYLKLQQLDRVLPTNEEGGEMDDFDMYQGYLNGKYDGTEQELEAEKIYDKLNRKHYREAKMHGMTTSNFIATHFLNKA